MLDLAFQSSLDESLGRFVNRFATEGKSVVMHWDHGIRAEHLKGIQRLLGIHVHGATAGGVVGTDGHEREVDAGTFADLLKAIEHGAVTTVVEAAVWGFD